MMRFVCCSLQAHSMDIYFNKYISQISYVERLPNRKNFMMNSMEQFREIMQQTTIEMEREVDRMPIGTFQ